MSFLDVLADVGIKALVGYLNITGGITRSIILGGCHECDCKKYVNDPFGKRDSDGFKSDCLCGHSADNHNSPFDWNILNLL